jgi:hypothetical protein
MKHTRFLQAALTVGWFVALPAVLRAQVILNFDNLPAEPGVTTYGQFSAVNSANSTFAGVTFKSSDFYVVGDQYVEGFNNNGGSYPFIQPQSGHYGLFNAFGHDALTLTTTQVMSEMWFARPNFGATVDGPTGITIKALNGATVLGSASMSLSLASGTMQRLDTSAFAGYSGITGYEIDRIAGTGPYGGGLWVADSIGFLAVVPEPAETAMAMGFALAGFGLARRGRGNRRF